MPRLITTFTRQMNSAVRRLCRLLRLRDAIASASLRAEFVGTAILAAWVLASTSSLARDLAATDEKAGAVTNAQRQGVSAVDPSIDRHKLAPGDRLSFRIAEDAVDPNESWEPKSLTVTDSGDLEVPYIGRYPAAGKTCKQLTAEIKTELESKYYFQATVLLALDLNTKSFGNVYVVGQVHQTGPVDLPGDETLTLSKAVLRAGGFTEYADKRHVKVTRRTDAEGLKSKSYTVDLSAVIEGGKTEKDMVLESGDTIFVPSRLFTF